jgi:hypothetical protein
MKNKPLKKYKDKLLNSVMSINKGVGYAPISRSSGKIVIKETKMLIDEEPDLLEYNFPLYMNYTQDVMFFDQIKKRQQFAKFVASIDKAVLKKRVDGIMKLTSTNLDLGVGQTNSTVSWIGGSRSWNHVYDKFIQQDVPQLNASTHTSVNDVGNYDIFILHNNPDTFEKLLNLIDIQVIKIFDELQKLLMENYVIKIEYPRGSFKKVNTNSLKLCTIFPCKSISISITSRHSRTRSKNASITKNIKLEEKLLLYVEIGYNQECNIVKLKETIIDPNDTYYLNGYGVYLFSLLINQSRAHEKGLDVDLYRDKLIKTYLDHKKVTYTTFNDDIIKLYENIFSNTESYHKYNLDKLYIDNILHHHQSTTTNDIHIKDTITQITIEALRPIINTCVLLIQDVLKHKINKKYDAYIVMIGGDAMRRYKKDITITNDFDTKVYYNGKNKDSFLDLILSCVTLCTELLELSTSYSTDNFVQRYTKQSSDTFDDYVITFARLVTANQGSFHNKEMFKLKKELLTNMFRIRYIEESTVFPVNLFSIDMNIPIHIKYRNNIYRSKITIPIFDVVVVENNTNNINHHTEKNDVIQTSSSIFPIASLNYLIHDLETTYNSKSSAKMRFIGEKNEKDKKRLQTLINLQQITPPLYNSDLNVLFKRFSKADIKTHEKQISNSRILFKSKITSNKRKGIHKHKLPFSKERISNIIPAKNCRKFNWDEIYDNIDYTKISINRSSHEQSTKLDTYMVMGG